MYNFLYCPSHMEKIDELTIALAAVHLDQIWANGGRYFVHGFLGHPSGSTSDFGI